MKVSQVFGGTSVSIFKVEKQTKLETSVKQAASKAMYSSETSVEFHRATRVMSQNYSS
jgi:hypothetical protein